MQETFAQDPTEIKTKRSQCRRTSHDRQAIGLRLAHQRSLDVESSPPVSACAAVAPDTGQRDVTCVFSRCAQCFVGRGGRGWAKTMTFGSRRNKVAQA